MKTEAVAENEIDFKIIDSEYKELNNHLRECWKYISELLKSFIFLQIVLISVVFLGGQVIKIENITMRTDESVISAEGDNDRISKISTEVANYKNYAIIPILTIGLLGSLGSLIQNHRLFKNAKNFVARAAFLENIAKFPVDNRDTERTSQSANRYMLKAMYEKDWYRDLEFLLAVVYAAFIFLWGFTAFKVIDIRYHF